MQSVLCIDQGLGSFSLYTSKLLVNTLYFDDKDEKRVSITQCNWGRKEGDQVKY